MAFNVDGTTGHSVFAWEIEADDDGVLGLQILVAPSFPKDVSHLRAIEYARALTDSRSGGWRYAYTKGFEPLLPWHPTFSPEEHAWMWIKLLKQHAIKPNLKGPAAG